MYCNVLSATMLGLVCRLITVEADISDGLPVFDMVGALACEVREAKERVRTALKNCGMPLPPKRITVNLSPADVRKEGSAFDLPIAVAVLCAMGRIEKKLLEDTLVIGELSLSGEVRPVRGILPIVMEAKKAGITRCILPLQNRREGSLVKEISCIGVSSLKETMEFLWGREKPVQEPADASGTFVAQAFFEDFSEIAGQYAVRRGAEIAAAGFHNLLMIGPPGGGKTMIARRIPSILPPLTMEESLEVTKVYSVAGLLPPERPLITGRPFRAPHHTVTGPAMVGGGAVPKPGEVSLASRGVLFLDELTEFQKGTLDLLRQPLEDRQVVLSRMTGTYVYPADFMLVAAMNPCKCGYFPDRVRCTCSSREISAYLGRISKPLLDRMDLCIETSKVPYNQLAAAEQGESSGVMQKRVAAAMERQKRRYAGSGYQFNSQLPGSAVKKYCPLGIKEEALLRQAFEKLDLSARAYHRVIRVARTIADLEGADRIGTKHIGEAVGYRSVDQKYWSRQGIGERSPF